MLISLAQLGGVSACAGILAWRIIPTFKENFVKAGVFGVDLNKKSKAKIPEALGVVVGCVFLVATILMIPLAFKEHVFKDDVKRVFPHNEFAELLAALLSIACMLLLGFADDVLDLKWRHKLLLPTLASLPLLIVYRVTTNRTDVVLPLILGSGNVDLGFFYYVYMGMLAVFCTNAINILAGVNGLEVGQSIVIAASVAIFNLGELDGPLGHHHRFSLYFLAPFIGTSLPLLAHNWYPARVFSGDTFCYFAGMTLAVVAILGHFSKTLLLFFVPQVVNFLYSVPQLFRWIPCPRHRLPKYDGASNKVGMSMAEFKAADANFFGLFVLNIFNVFGLVHLRRYEKDGEDFIECNNLTLINFALKIFGPMHERNLTLTLLLVQVVFSVIAFGIRYPLALLFYGKIEA